MSHKVSNNQRSQRQLVFTRIFNKDRYDTSNALERHLQRKMERMQSMSSGGVFKKNSLMKRGSNI